MCPPKPRTIRGIARGRHEISRRQRSPRGTRLKADSKIQLELVTRDGAAAGTKKSPSGAGARSGLMLQSMDVFFTAIFAGELGLVLYANWLSPFFSDGWCVYVRARVRACVCLLCSFAHFQGLTSKLALNSILL